MKMAVFWVVALCSLVEVYQRFRGPCCLHHQGDDCFDDGGSKDLWNVGKLLPDYMALQPTRQPSSYSPPWEPKILLNFLHVFWLKFCMHFSSNLCVLHAPAHLTDLVILIIFEQYKLWNSSHANFSIFLRLLNMFYAQSGRETRI
jgi:hypothetical protein